MYSTHLILREKPRPERDGGSWGSHSHNFFFPALVRVRRLLAVTTVMDGGREQSCLAWKGRLRGGQAPT